MRPLALAITVALGGCSLLPERQPQRPMGAASGAQTSLARPDAARCLASLGATGAKYAPLNDRYYAPGCQAVGSVRLDRLQGDKGQFALANLGPVSCPLAERFAGWARFGVDRAARQILGSPLARIETMGSYACRSVGGSARLSAHARAEAIDVGGFVLADGRRISVRTGWSGSSSQERAFLRTVHQSACKRFGTVLGPGYNAAHADHLHVELGAGTFCR